MTNLATIITLLFPGWTLGTAVPIKTSTKISHKSPLIRYFTLTRRETAAAEQEGSEGSSLSMTDRFACTWAEFTTCRKYVSEVCLASSSAQAFSSAWLNDSVWFSSKRSRIKVEDIPLINESLFMSSLYAWVFTATKLQFRLSLFSLNTNLCIDSPSCCCAMASKCREKTSFLGFTRGVWKVLSINKTKLPGYHTDWIPSEGPHSNWTPLFWTTEASKGSNQRKKAKKAHKRNLLPPRQCTSSHLRGFPWQQFTIADLNVPHSPYLPDLAPSNFDLFPQMKKALTGSHFASDEGHNCSQGVFWVSSKRVALHGDKSASAPWEQVFSPWRGYAEK